MTSVMNSLSVVTVTIFYSRSWNDKDFNENVLNSNFKQRNVSEVWQTLVVQKLKINFQTPNYDAVPLNG